MIYKNKRIAIITFLSLALIFALYYIFYLTNESVKSYSFILLTYFLEAFPEILGSFVAVFLTIIFIELIIPYFRNKHINAKQKLDSFYTVAYAFVKIRQDFYYTDSSNIVHNKQNCGFFHSFDETQENSNERKTNSLSSRNGLIFDEYQFLTFASTQLSIMTTELRELFIEYLNYRFVQAQNIKNYSCKDSKLVRLRNEIEETVIKDYNNISKDL